MNSLKSIMELLADINIYSVAVRIFLATFMGGCIGMNRFRHGRAAGARTHILVCLGAAITTLLGFYTAANLGFPNDPLRLGAQAQEYKINRLRFFHTPDYLHNHRYAE